MYSNIDMMIYRSQSLHPALHAINAGLQVAVEQNRRLQDFRPAREDRTWRMLIRANHRRCSIVLAHSAKEVGMRKKGSQQVMTRLTGIAKWRWQLL